MTRRLARLTLDTLADLREPCRECLFWELDPVRRTAVCGHEAEEKAGWLSTVLREWGSAGRVLYVDEQPAGHLVWAPPVFVPGSDGFATAPVSPDAVVLATAWVAREHRGGGLGRVLVQAMAKDLIQRGGIRAVEAFGDARGRGGECTLPAEFLRRTGFRTQRAHAAYPRMRMDLRTTLTWRAEIEGALERLRGVVAPKPAPQPAPSRARS